MFSLSSLVSLSLVIICIHRLDSSFHSFHLYHEHRTICIVSFISVFRYRYFMSVCLRMSVWIFRSSPHTHSASITFALASCVLVYIMFYFVLFWCALFVDVFVMYQMRCASMDHRLRARCVFISSQHFVCFSLFSTLYQISHQSSKHVFFAFCIPVISAYLYCPVFFCMCTF